MVNLLDAFPLLTSGQLAIGEAILDTFKALYFFLDRECIGLSFLLKSFEVNLRQIKILDQSLILIASQLGKNLHPYLFNVFSLAFWIWTSLGHFNFFEGVLPVELDKRIVHLLTDCLLPYALCDPQDDDCRVSVPAVLMLVFQRISDPSWSLIKWMSVFHE